MNISPAHESVSVYRPGCIIAKTHDSNGEALFLLIVPYSAMNGGKAYSFPTLKILCKGIPKFTTNDPVPYISNLYGTPKGFVVMGSTGKVVAINELEMKKVENLVASGREIFQRTKPRRDPRKAKAKKLTSQTLRV